MKLSRVLLVLSMLSIPATAMAEAPTLVSSKNVGSASYDIELDDVRDRLIHWELFPGMAYFARGITLGFAGSIDLRFLSWLQLEVHAQGPYKTFIQNPNGPYIGEAILVFGGSDVKTEPSNVELTRSSKYRATSSTTGIVTTKTKNLTGVSLSERTRSPIRLGARVLHGSTDPSAPSNKSAVDKRIDGTILWAFLGFGLELMSNWRVAVEGYGKRSTRSQLGFGMDIMYAPLRDYEREPSDARDDFLFPLGARFVTRMGSVAPFGFATKLDIGLNGAGAGWYAMIAFGVGGSAVPLGKEQ